MTFHKAQNKEHDDISQKWKRHNNTTIFYKTAQHFTKNYNISQNRKIFEETEHFTKHNILKSKTYFIKL